MIDLRKTRTRAICAAIVAAHAYSSEDQFMPMRPPGALRNYLNWNRPRKLTIGPPVYLDRP